MRPTCKLFVEGGGDHNDALKTECRRAFSALLEKAGLKGRMPRIVACGSRRNAFEQFCTAMEDGESLAFLLVDSEGPVSAESPWKYVAGRPGDEWEQPADASDDQLHLMVQCMEAWFLADRKALVRFFGQGLTENALPALTASHESISKTELFRKLDMATRSTKLKGTYGKGTHSFKLLARVDPDLIRKASPWAERFFATLDRLIAHT